MTGFLLLLLRFFIFKLDVLSDGVIYKIHTTWKFRVNFYSVGMLGLSLSLGDNISGDPKWADCEEAGGEPGYTHVCSQGQVIWILKGYC